MKTPPIPTDGLIVARADLAEALGIVSHLMGRRVSGASLRFEDGWLFVAAGRAVAKAPAQGVWPLTTIVGPNRWFGHPHAHSPGVVCLAVQRWVEGIYARYGDGRTKGLSNFAPARSTLPVVVPGHTFPRRALPVLFGLDRGT
jgi:hypothetical protein